ncbi:SUKH-4 family immunity protein [Catenuloplanes sp. NPDC051500]|uniref:SUKH-4 family immunity protein n=1 Tax=Catenuloplanes sp. NPDC051500 TaxID=3363959 RepID=UPI0037A3060E
MIDEVRRKAEAVRATIAADGRAGVFGPKDPAADVSAALPAGLREVLQVMDGFVTASVRLFSTTQIPSSQRTLQVATEFPAIIDDPDRWLVIGEIDEAPLLLDRRDGRIWWFPDTSVTWWDSTEFVPVAADAVEFADRFLLGAEYENLAADVRWEPLLRRAGAIN